MARNDQTSVIIDHLLRFAAAGTVMTTAVLAPNALRALDKPLKKFYGHLDAAERERELRRVVSYMKARGYLVGPYEHGLKITAKGRRRLQEADFDTLVISRPARWDHTWRIIFYDIPEEHRTGRNHLVTKLRQLAMHQLQRSVWIHPFDCRQTIEAVAGAFELEQYVSYIETPHLDNENVLLKRFQRRYPSTNFK